MRLRGDRALVLERALRALSMALIAFALWRALQARGAGGTVVARSAVLARELPSIEAGRAASLHVELDGVPSPPTRDALAALAHAGTRVTWSGPALPRLAAVADRAREPGGPVRIAVVSDAAVLVSDGEAPPDSVPEATAARGATIDAGEASGAYRAGSGAVHAVVGVPAAATLRPVLVIGRAGWEAKFTAAALEEQGWRVVVRFVVAPGRYVTQGSAAPIDTSRFSAIVALDTALGAVGPSVVRFVRQGGGLVLLADAANAGAVRSIAPARAGARRPAADRSFDVADPVQAMPVHPLESLRGDALELSRRNGLVTVAARREGAGRVLQAGYTETWRWRMQGGAGAVGAHRAWWSGLVGSVAAAPAPPAGATASAEGAPLARLLQALGPATLAAPAPTAPSRWPAWLLPAVLLSLLGEWGSRRWRGAA